MVRLQPLLHLLPPVGCYVQSQEEVWMLSHVVVHLLFGLCFLLLFSFQVLLVFLLVIISYLIAFAVFI